MGDVNEEVGNVSEEVSDVNEIVGHTQFLDRLLHLKKWFQPFHDRISHQWGFSEGATD